MEHLLAHTIFSGVPQYLLAGAVLAVAELVAVLFGFGAGLIAVGTLAMVMADVQDPVVVLLLVSLPVELTVVYISRRQVQWRGLALLGVGVVPGIPLGTLALKQADPVMVLTLLGGFLLLVGGAFLALPRARTVRWPAWTAPLVGLLGGALGGMFGTGGPPVILYYRLAGLPKSAFRGSLMAVFTLYTLLRLPSYALGGLLTGARALSAAAVFPWVLVGAFAGHRIHLEIAEQTFQRLVAALLVAMGVLLLLR